MPLVNKLSANDEEKPKKILAHQYNLSLPGAYKPICEEMRDGLDGSGLGSIKSVIEYALRKHFSANPRGYDKHGGEMWHIKITIPEDIMAEIDARTPQEFGKIRDAVIISLVELIKDLER